LMIVLLDLPATFDETDDTPHGIVTGKVTARLSRNQTMMAFPVPV